VDHSIPPIQYAKNGDVHIAYQVFGEGPTDLLYITGAVGNLRLWWEEPSCRRFWERLASFSRVILFNKRGMGLSDRGNFGTLAGSGIEFRDRGVTELKDVPGEWQLFAVRGAT
jgi:pimeloyl-ACP methyl ester carboxylesterase